MLYYKGCLICFNANIFFSHLLLICLQHVFSTEMGWYIRSCSFYVMFDDKEKQVEAEILSAYVSWALEH